MAPGGGGRHAVAAPVQPNAADDSRGRGFKRHVDALLHQLGDGIAAVGQLIEPKTGTVALAFQQSLGPWLVPDLVRTFRAASCGLGAKCWISNSMTAETSSSLSCHAVWTLACPATLSTISAGEACSNSKIVSPW